MSAERAMAAFAANRNVPDSPSSAWQDCRDEVHILLFFDGTGNNKEADVAEKKWSNVARLFESAYRAAQLNKKRVVFPIYIPEVGTKYNGVATNWLEAAGVWVEDNILGLGAGGGGDRRMEHGADLINKSLQSALIANAATLDRSMRQYLTSSSEKSLDDINSVVGQFRLIKEVNFSLFGFSRGAALARAFANRLVQKFDRSDGKFLYQGYPARLNFIGLFDTVASFGIPSMNARTPLTERELLIPTEVERCVHYIAAHELRFSFPVDLIRKNGVLPAHWVEKVFPGAHSDVGGGYAPREQGVDNNFARIPLREMMAEAIRSGARLISYEDLQSKFSQLFNERFQCSPETEASYSRYSAALVGHGNTVEQQVMAHMKLFYSANGTMHRRGQQTASQRSLSDSRLKRFLGPKGMAAEVVAAKAPRKRIRLVRFGGSSAESFAQYVTIQDWQLAAWESDATEGVVEFVSRYVHDSKVDFLLNAEPFSYFRSRGIAESSTSVWTEFGGWATGKYSAAADSVKNVAIATKQKVADAKDYAAEKIDQSCGVASAALDSAAKNAREVAARGQAAWHEVQTETARIYENGVTWIQGATDKMRK